MFPAGIAGVALLLLRATVAATLVVNGTQHGSSATSLGWLVLISLPAIFMVVGFLTPYACLVACLMQVSILSGSIGANAFDLLISMLNSGILAVLGPGAYSVDARAFGRRIVMFPPGQ